MPQQELTAVHGRQARVIVEGVEMSCFVNNASINLTKDITEATAFCNAIKGYVPGLPDGTMNMSGFYDSRQNALEDEILSRYQGTTNRLRFVVANEGHAAGVRSKASVGIVQTYNTNTEVASTQTVQLDTQLTGEVYVMHNLFHFLNDALVTGTLTQEVQRSVLFGASSSNPKYGATPTFDGYVYIQARNNLDAGDLDLTVTHGASTAPSTELGSITVGQGETGVALLTSSATGGVTSIGDFIQIETTQTVGAGETVEFYLGLVDPTLSLLNT